MSEVSFLDIDGQHEIISHFDLISIDQRGVLSTQDTYERQGKWGAPPPCPFEESGQGVKPFPEVYCDEAAKHNLGSVKQVLEQLVTVGHNQSMEELARTYVLPIYLNRGIPVSVLTEGNESFVRWYYRLVRLEHSLCFEAPRYKIQAPNGRMYNTLQFAGTIDLAYDIEAWQKFIEIPRFHSFLLHCFVCLSHTHPQSPCIPFPLQDLLRQAIGAERMSLYGVSYGTSVAGVYATVFPQHTHRVVMDGALHPAPDAAVRGENFAFASQSFWDGIVRDCEALHLVRAQIKQFLWFSKIFIVVARVPRFFDVLSTGQSMNGPSESRAGQRASKSLPRGSLPSSTRSGAKGAEGFAWNQSNGSQFFATIDLGCILLRILGPACNGMHSAVFFWQRCAGLS